MKKCLLFVILCSCLSWGQSFTTGKITDTSSTCGTNDESTTTACVVLPLQSNAGTVTIAVRGTFTGTLQFEVSAANGASWAAKTCYPPNSTVGASSTTSTGTWICPAMGATDHIRVRASAFANGTASVQINQSTASASLNTGVPLNPPGAANDLACILGVNVLGPCDSGNATYSSSTLFVPNETVTGTLCSGPGVATDGSTLINEFAVSSAGNYVLATTADTINPTLTIQTANHAICSQVVDANHGMFAHNGDTVTIKSDAIGIADAHWVGASGVTAATGVDCGAFSGNPTCSLVCGYTKNGGAIAANGTGTMVFTGCGKPIERAITFNLVKSGAVGAFYTIDYACTIYRVDVTADVSGTFAMDVWRANAAIPASGGKISGTSWTPLSGAQSSFNTSLSGWTSSGAIPLASGDVLGGTVPTFTTVSSVQVTIRCH